jgi:hypothetical protein
MNWLDHLVVKMPHLLPSIYWIGAIMALAMSLGALAKTKLMRNVGIIFAVPFFFLAYRGLESLFALWFEDWAWGLLPAIPGVLILCVFTLGGLFIISPDLTYKEGQIVVREKSLTDRIVYTYASLNRNQERSLCSLSWSVAGMLLVGVPIGLLMATITYGARFIGLILTTLMFGEDPRNNLPWVLGKESHKCDLHFYRGVIPLSPGLYMVLGGLFYVGFTKWIWLVWILEVILSTIVGFYVTSIHSNRQEKRLKEKLSQEYKDQHSGFPPSDYDLNLIVDVYQAAHPGKLVRAYSMAATIAKIIKGHICPKIVSQSGNVQHDS